MATKPQQQGKRRKVIYKDAPDEKVAELEEFLFGSKTADARAVFAKRVEPESDDDLTLTDLLAPGGQLFFEDKGDVAAARAAFDFTSSDEDSDADNTSDNDDSASGSGSDGSESGSEQGEDTTASPDSDQGGDGDKGTRGHKHRQKDRDSGEGQSGSASEESGDESGSGSDGEDEAAQRRHGAAGTAGPSGAAANRRRQAVWSDPADRDIQVDLSSKARLRKLRNTQNQTVVDGGSYERVLRKQHAVLNPRTGWASLNKKNAKKRAAGSDEDPDDTDLQGVLEQAGGVLAPRPARLQPGSLETSRFKDANIADPSKAVVQSVGWHPTGQLFMTGGLDKRIRLFKIDGADNPLVQSVFLRDCPVHQSALASGGTQVVASGRRPFFYLYDLASSRVEKIQPSAGNAETLKSLESFATTLPGSTGPNGHMMAFYGDQGFVPLVSLQSRQWVGSLKMSGSVRCAAWAPGGTQLLTLGGDGIVYTWDIRQTRQCVHQLRDHANIRPTALAISPDSRYIATGSESGALNLYPGSAAGLVGAMAGDGGDAYRPPAALGAAGVLGGGVVSVQPLKEVLNLTTTVDSIAFSHDSQMVAFSSRMKKDAMRLLHIPSYTVFSNWPTSRSPLHYVHSLAFSPHSGFLTIGNARGRALLYRLHYYQEA